jgi:YHS domain-containing protein
MKSIIVALALSFGSVSLADGFNVGLGGYCPVGFVKAGKSVFGDPKYASTYEGVTYFNSSQDAKALFDKDPASFVKAIKYDGYCATGLSLGKKLKSDPNIHSELGGAVYFFSSAEAKEMFDKAPKDFIAKADAAWKSHDN